MHRKLDIEILFKTHFVFVDGCELFQNYLRFFFFIIDLSIRQEIKHAYYARVLADATGQQVGQLCGFLDYLPILTSYYKFILSVAYNVVYIMESIQYNTLQNLTPRVSNLLGDWCNMIIWHKGPGKINSGVRKLVIYKRFKKKYNKNNITTNKKMMKISIFNIFSIKNQLYGHYFNISSYKKCEENIHSKKTNNDQPTTKKYIR
ncbi:hypothetical protein AGLY_012810 [Aphis glycines]|uniref:Uncharacterized protein n=1 Tax=Aphis glycines TaxID=307491 RepID=A0A6G0T929_APHGL|nr:hypothetical protein AGLY_012810 [Aphis glycines]